MIPEHFSKSFVKKVKFCRPQIISPSIFIAEQFLKILLRNKMNQDTIFNSEQEQNDSFKKSLWKLFKGKTVLIYHLCGDCHQRLFNSTDKIQELGDSWLIKFELCKECVIKNCKATTALTKPYSRPIKEESKWANKQFVNNQLFLLYFLLLNYSPIYLKDKNCTWNLLSWGIIFFN